MTAPIEADDFKVYFDRDFKYGATKENVRDSDIDRAIAEANALFNPALWTAGVDLEIAFEFLTAHCLCVNIGAAGGLGESALGLKSSGSFPVQSKSAGPLSVGYVVPQEMADNPILNQFMTTKYGLRYLELLAPNLLGNFGIGSGATQP
jgi:hypothetical protein